MKLQIADNLSAVEFSKYEPTAYRSTAPKVIRGKRELSAIRSAFHGDLEETEFYSEDPELARYHVKLVSDREDFVKVKVVHHFVQISGQYYHSQSKTLWNLLERLAQKKPLLARVRKIEKGQKIEWMEEPHFAAQSTKRER